MANWLAALGAGALEGSRQIGLRREEDRLEEARRLARERDLLQMALLKKNALRDDARLMLEMAGPGGQLDPEAAKVVQEGGFGFRLRGQPDTLPARQFTVGPSGAPEMVNVPSQPGGFTVMPTAAEQAMLDELAAKQAERERQRRYREIIDSDRFFAQPFEKRQKIWTAAGYAGQVPETPEERQQLLEMQHRFRMKELDRMYPAERFDRNDPTKQWLSLYQNNLGRAVQLAQAEAYRLRDEGEPVDMQRLMAEAQRIAQAETEAILGPRPGTPQSVITGGGSGDPIMDFLSDLNDEELHTLLTEFDSPGVQRELARNRLNPQEVRQRLQSLSR